MVTQREFRKKHAPEGPPFIGVNIREGDAYCLTQGIVPDSIRQMCADGLRVFWPTEIAESGNLPRQTPAAKTRSRTARRLPGSRS